MSQVGDLLELQARDTELASVEASIRALESRLAGSDELNAAAADLAEAEAALTDARREQRRLDALVEDLTARIKQEEARLYGGSVKSPKELASLQQEVDHLKARRSGFEEELLAVLATVDAASERRQTTAAVHERLAAAWDATTAEGRAELGRLQAVAEAARTRRNEQRSQLQSVPLLLYDALRKRRGDTVVVRIQNGNCQGCRVTLPDALRRRAATSPLPMQCPNCERILAGG